MKPRELKTFAQGHLDRRQGNQCRHSPVRPPAYSLNSREILTHDVLLVGFLGGFYILLSPTCVGLTFSSAKFHLIFLLTDCLGIFGLWFCHCYLYLQQANCKCLHSHYWYKYQPDEHQDKIQQEGPLMRNNPLIHHYNLHMFTTSFSLSHQPILTYHRISFLEKPHLPCLHILSLLLYLSSLASTPGLFHGHLLAPLFLGLLGAHL